MIAALGLGSSFTVIITMIGVGVSAVLDTLVSEQVGAKKRHLAPATLTRATFVVSITSILLFAVMLLSGLFFNVLGTTNANVATLAQTYCAIVAFGMWAHQMGILFSLYLQANDVSWLPMIVHLASTLLCAPLVYVCIVWNLYGAAVVAVFHRWVLFVGMLIATWRFNKYHGLPLFRWSMNVTAMKNFILMAIPSTLHVTFEFLGFEIMTLMGAKIRATVLSAHTIVSNIILVCVF